ncbi:hypothetical protein D3H64_09260, partial [Atopobacter sp. AH10]|uniref:polymorphic toxin type 50 domain-containing protein n=1 Tax=Atopobacter sp. AH10 TaxID=2315861 RepID=UPI000FF76B9A
KSYFYDDVDVEELYNKYKMTGVLKITKSGAYGNREKITLTADLHLGIDVYTKKDINAITIHYSKTGVHLIPTYYEN